MSIMDNAIELGARIRKKEIKIEEAVRVSLDRIQSLDGDYNCFISVEADYAMERARMLQSKLDKGQSNNPLFGVPISVKDNICVSGLETTCGSKMLKDFVPCYSATAVDKLEDAGMIILGKTNMDEFAMGNSTENSYFGVTRNPWDKTKVAGGSSGGAAASVALGFNSVSLGSDTGGSVRQPASFCGVVGIKPTYGRVSRNGLIAYASSLDQIGTFGKNVKDAATLLEVVAGCDEKDSTTSNGKRIDLQDAFSGDVNGMRVALPVDLMEGNADADTIRSIENVVNILEKNGVTVDRISIGMKEYVLPTYYIIACAEASSNLERYDGVKYGYRSNNYDNLHQMYRNTRTEGFGAEVKRRIMLGSFVLSAGYYDAYYLKALRSKSVIRTRLKDLFNEYDGIISPVTPGGAFAIGKYTDNNVDSYNEDIFTVWANLAGIPAMSVPCGTDSDGMPIGVQIISSAYDERTMIKLGLAIEREIGKLSFQNGKGDIADD